MARLAVSCWPDVDFACLNEAPSPRGSLVSHDASVSSADDRLTGGVPHNAELACTGVGYRERQESISWPRSEHVCVTRPEFREALPDVHRHGAFKIVKRLTREFLAAVAVGNHPRRMDAPQEAPSILDCGIVRGREFNESGQTLSLARYRRKRLD